ncbi:hypothetical protein [Arthrobacter sp. A2-55]|uniref:hypothetical protein n=1 Tax=Arthrobacter sp. A2-55 TaxID=2897337 RepID=UPI0021CD506E|nr:hypothetical protein [Arthrobacter sp. A2-55]MCU6480143.1 hypothetical protein [Arthrobacter sp. A2-55]
MKRIFAVLGTTALLGAGLILGAAPAQALSCGAGMHVVDGFNGPFCAPDTNAGGSGSGVDFGGGTSSGGGGTISAPGGDGGNDCLGCGSGPAPAPYVPPAAPRPAPAPYVPPASPQVPAYAPPAQAYTPPEQGYNPPANSGGGYGPPADPGATSYVDPGSGAAVVETPSGEWVNPDTGVAADPAVAAKAQAKATAAKKAAAVVAQQAAEKKVLATKVAAIKVSTVQSVTYAQMMSAALEALAKH